jgi:hypothetical protein
MLTVNYVESERETGTLSFDCDTMTDVVAVVETTYNFSFSPKVWAAFMDGIHVKCGEALVWLEESN